MEEIKRYISGKLVDMRDRVKNIHLTYIYEKGLDYHTIIVEPTDVFETNSLFHRLEKELMDDVFAKYGVSDILFTEKVSYIEVKEEEVILCIGPLNFEEGNNMSFNYDMFDLAVYKNNNQGFDDSSPYALAA